MPEIIKPKSKDNGKKNKYSTNGWIYETSGERLFN